MTSHDPEGQGRDPKMLCPVSQKRLEIQTWLQWSTYRKWCMASRMVWCSMSSRVPVFLIQTDYILSPHFYNRWNCLEIYKNSKYSPNRKNFSLSHSQRQSCIVSHIETANMIKVILISSTLTFWQGALSNITFIIFAVFDVWNNARLPLTT